MDHRKKSRRRGEALCRAIFQATFDELAAVGYTGSSMERIAERAHTSKASLYRRWTSRAELVADAIRHTIPDPDELPDTGDLREDVLALLRLIANLLAGPVGEAARGLIAETLRDPELAQIARTRILASRPELMLQVLRRAAVRGEVRPEALTPRVANVGPVLLRHHFLVHGAPIPDRTLTEIVDDVVLPLVRSRPEDGHVLPGA
ncbi:MAG: TetR/AcrR family transcriptional regulator [Egibacteraceae bacterium]